MTDKMLSRSTFRLFVARLVAAVFSLLCRNVVAAQVMWDVFECYSDSDSAYVFYYDRVTPEMGLSYNYSDDYWRKITSLSPNGNVNIGNNRTYWVLASYGEALETFDDFHGKRLIQDTWVTLSNSVSLGDDIDVLFDGYTFYAACFGLNGTHDGIDSVYYAWVQLEVDKSTGISIIDSALSYGQPLVVGTYETIPEPSSAVLLLVGGAMLALRRRCGCNADGLRMEAKDINQ